MGVQEFGDEDFSGLFSGDYQWGQRINGFENTYSGLALSNV